MNLNEIIENNLKDHLVVSEFDDESFKDIELCLGIDEAGRGPVLGPMVYAGLFCPIDKEQQLKEMECADSKALSEKEREKIFKKINEQNEFCGYAIKVLSPNTISTRMLRKVKYNLNELSHDTAMCIIDKLCNERKLNIVQVYLDTVGDPTKYELKLSKRFPKLKIKVSKKADSIYPCVSAASICAKVTRDNILKNWKFSERLDLNNFGSGYPGDPATKKFLDASLNKVFGFVKLVRFSWSTAAIKMKKSCVQIKWSDHFEDDLDENDQEEQEDETEDGEETKKKQPTTKKPTKSNKPSKLSLAVASDKNNASLLNFFQKSQKRPISSSSSSSSSSSDMTNNDKTTPANNVVVSQFFLNRNLKLIKIF